MALSEKDRPTPKELARQTVQRVMEHEKKHPDPDIPMDVNPLDYLQDLSARGDLGARRLLRRMLSKTENHCLFTQNCELRNMVNRARPTSQKKKT